MKSSGYYLNRFSAKSVIFWLLSSSGYLWADNRLETIQNLRFAIVYVEEPPFNQTWQHNMPRINQALAKITHSGEVTKIVQSQLQSTRPL
jgi:hypothetical protein